MKCVKLWKIAGLLILCTSFSGQAWAQAQQRPPGTPGSRPNPYADPDNKLACGAQQSVLDDIHQQKLRNNCRQNPKMGECTDLNKQEAATRSKMRELEC